MKHPELPHHPLLGLRWLMWLKLWTNWQPSLWICDGLCWGGWHLSPWPLGSFVMPLLDQVPSIQCSVSCWVSCLRSSYIFAAQPLFGRQTMPTRPFSSYPHFNFHLLLSKSAQVTFQPIFPIIQKERRGELNHLFASRDLKVVWEEDIQWICTHHHLHTWSIWSQSLGNYSKWMPVLKHRYNMVQKNPSQCSHIPFTIFHSHVHT